MKDYLLEVKVKNGLIVSAMREAGYKTVADLSRACKTKQATLGSLLNLKTPACDIRGNWKKVVLRLCERLNKMPSDLFNEQQQSTALKTNKAEKFISQAELTYAMQNTKSIEESLDADTCKIAFQKALLGLTVREHFVLNNRFGIDGEEKTLDALSAEMGLSRERVRQIEGKALRKLRHPSRSGEIREFATTWPEKRRPEKRDEQEWE